MQNTFGKEILTADEPQRLAALQRYKLIGTYAEKSFQNIAKLVAEVFDVRIAMISLVDAEEVRHESVVGIEQTSTPRGSSLCSLTILQDEVNIIEDTFQEPLVANNPFVCGDFGLRFYAGAPLITFDGFRIGAVCLGDTSPRKFYERDCRILEGMAKVVMEQIELRLQTLNDAEIQNVSNKQLSESNRKLTESELRFQNILDTMAEGVGIVDLTGQLIYANSMAQRILGLTHSEIKDRTYDDPRWQNLRVDGTPLPPEEHPMAIMMKTGLSLFDQEIGVQPPDKERFYISINAAPIIDQETGKLTGGIGTFMDVTSRRHILQQKDEFINVASHELKTPVTSMKAAMQILERMKDNPNPQVLSNMIVQANKSMDKLMGLLNDLLNSNRISQGQLNLRKTTFSIGDLATDCCNHVRITNDHEIVLKGDLETEVEADAQQIDQVLVNLVNNAVKYAPQSKEIVLTVESLPEEVKILVSDQGPGIEAKLIPRLFERYYRADHSSYQFSGLGLGLYICSEIVKKHGGKIGAESVMGQGSTFWFTLPKTI